MMDSFVIKYIEEHFPNLVNNQAVLKLVSNSWNHWDDEASIGQDTFDVLKAFNEVVNG